MVYTVAVRMCSTTGSGIAKNRALPGVISAPAVSSVSRAAPAITGTAPSRISPVIGSRSRQVVTDRSRPGRWVSRERRPVVVLSSLMTRS
ncbi:hypothetical protein Sru01_43940 [Sphaerisporangium rufum]|uniref:Uncharacterized protein n=1 Tax=Sphaerisporangium rufum TaxID=1381558 RepID=A0A919R488_9ACTN|nr:hypothetical protein Sru01_43940 [Sphaerisporangium rufum]